MPPIDCRIAKEPKPVHLHMINTQSGRVPRVEVHSMSVSSLLKSCPVSPTRGPALLEVRLQSRTFASGIPCLCHPCVLNRFGRICFLVLSRRDSKHSAAPPPLARNGYIYTLDVSYLYTKIAPQKVEFWDEGIINVKRAWPARESAAF